jgi:hypothetical protein
MGIEFGRISGPLLAANLQRDGVDLAFENNLLYLDVTNGKVGINSYSPSTELFVNSQFRTTNLTVSTTFTTPNYSISTNRIQNLVGTVYLRPDQSTDPVISGPGFGTRNYATSTNYLNVSDRLIQNVTADSDINLRTPGTGKVVFNTSQLYVKGALTATGKITFDGDITFGDNSTDNVVFAADINSDIIPNIDITYDLGKDLNRWANIYTIQLIPNTVSINNLSVGNTLTANGPTKFDGNVVLGNASTDTIAFNGLVDSNIIPASGSQVLGNNTTPLRWNTLFLADALSAGSVTISNNQITTTSTDTDLVLKAAGTGIIHLATSNVEITNNLTDNGLTRLKNTTIIGTLDLANVIAVGNINQNINPTGTSDLYITGKFANNNITVQTPSYISVPNIKFINNNIQVTALNTDLNLKAAGTGRVIFGTKLGISNNTFISKNNLPIKFKPNGLGSTVINSTKSLVLPYANDTNRVLSQRGEIRQNSTTQLYEGYSPNGLVSFNNVYDSARNTYITPELYPGAGDNIIRFVSNNVEKATIDATKLYADSFRAKNVNIIGNAITNNISSNDLTITPNGAGSTIINRIPFKDNTIGNLTNDAFILASTDDGYVKFGGTGAVLFPSGDVASRLANPEIGAYRHNTETGLQEVFDGARWVNVSGSFNNITMEDLESELNFWGVILG